MQLFLVQHGDAVPETVDPQRPLTEIGRTDIQRLADFLAAAGVRAGRVVHSGKLRASASAAILIEAVGSGATVEVMESGLLPKDSPEYLSDAIVTWQEDTLLVGHQPFLGRLLSRLVLGKEQPQLVDFSPGTLVGLVRRPATGAWLIGCMLSPELLRR